MRVDPTDLPHVESAGGASVLMGGEPMFRCTRHDETFTAEQFRLSDGCPACEDRHRRGAL